MATVETVNLTKHFAEGVTAVDGIDLASRDGEFLVLLGPSRLRQDDAAADDRRARAADLRRRPDRRPGRHRSAAARPPDRDGLPDYALYPHMTVYNNIAFPLKAQKVAKPAQRQKVEWAAGILGIDQLLKRKPRQLSGGQRQRVALARALVREPNVFLLDEPLSNLDAQRRASARDELQQFQRKIGTTTIYVTHDQVEAMGMGDRIAVMDHGRIRQLGTPQRDLRRAGRHLRRHLPRLPADEPAAARTASSSASARSTSSSPEPAARADDRRPFPFHVHREEYLGAERLLYGEIGEAKAVARFPTTVPVAAAPGASYDFGVRRRDLKTFDTRDGPARGSTGR